MAPCAVDRVLLLLLFSAPMAHAVDTCLQPSGLAGLIFGCIFGTVLVCVIVALLLWWLLKSRKPGEKILVIEKPSEHTVYDNRAFDVEDKGVATEGTPARPRRVKKTRDQATSNDTLHDKPKKRPSLVDRIRPKKSLINSQSTESLQALKENTTVLLKSRDLSGLGFNIHGNMSDGIYVKDVLEYGPAIESGKIFAGDRLMSVSINFEKMVFEDALTILSYASPYTVTLELQRRVDKGAILTEQKESNRLARLHPLFRSQSIGDTKPTSPEPRSEARRALSLHTTAPARVAETSAFDNRDLSPIVENVAQMHRVTVEMEIHARTPTPTPPPTSSDDPYSELSASEKFEVMQLSFDEPVTSVSSPDLYQPLEVDTVEEMEDDTEDASTPSPPPPPKPILSRADPIESDNDSLPDVEIIKKQFELNRLELRTPSPPPPVPTASISVQKFGKSDDDALSPIIHRQLPRLPPSAVSPKPSKEDDADVAMRLYQQRRQMLKPTTERGSWAKTTNSDAGSEYSETVSALTSPTASNGGNFFSNSQASGRRETGMHHASTDPAMRSNGAPKRTPLAHEDSLDKEQVTKLMYNQQYLVKQQEELARMGIHVPLHNQLKPIGKGTTMTQSSSVSQIRF